MRQKINGFSLGVAVFMFVLMAVNLNEGNLITGTIVGALGVVNTWMAFW